MIIKKIYEGIANLPQDNENWKLGIVLMKGKQFYYDTFARKLTPENDDNPFIYQHAYFSLSGDILETDKKMSSQLILIFKQIINSKQKDFTEELIMATKSTLEKKVRTITLELGQFMKENKTKETWTKAGELNSVLKTEEAQTLPVEFLESIRHELRGYYYVNGELNKLQKQLYAKGSKLLEIANL